MTEAFSQNDVPPRSQRFPAFQTEQLRVQPPGIHTAKAPPPTPKGYNAINSRKCEYDHVKALSEDGKSVTQAQSQW